MCSRRCPSLPITKVRGGTLLHSLRNYSCYSILSVCKTIQIVWHSCQSARDNNTRRAATETVTAIGWRYLATERLRWKATDSALKRGQKSDTSKQGRTSSETGTGAVHSASWKFNHTSYTCSRLRDVYRSVYFTRCESVIFTVSQKTKKLRNNSKGIDVLSWKPTNWQELYQLPQQRVFMLYNLD